MAWDGIQFRDQDGNDVPEETRQTLLALIERGLGTPDADPDKLINTASAVCANIGNIKNLAAYANRSIFRAVNKSYMAEKRILNRSEPLPEDDEAPVVAGPEEPVERQILLDRMLGSLEGQERQIYELHLQGYSFAEIDKRLRLKSRTSEYKYREAQLRLRRMLPPRP